MIIVPLHRLASDRKANVSTLFGLLIVPIIFSTGMAVDYTSASQKKAILDATADAAALAAVTPAMLLQSDAIAKTAAQNMFNGQVTNIPGLNYSPVNLTVNSTTSSGIRTVSVSYTASSQNTFGILGQAAWTFSGSATATATPAANVDFYLLLDNSPSMAIAATTAGINKMVANTQAQGGCAFACHQRIQERTISGTPEASTITSLRKTWA